MEKINSFPNKPWFSHVCRTSHLKTLWEKEKMLVTGIFSFSHNVFYPLGEFPAIFIKFENNVCTLSLFGKSPKFVVWDRINPFPNKPWFLRVSRTSLLKTLLVTRNFSFFPCYFSTRLENFLPFLSNSKLSSANSFNLEGSKIYHLGKG